MKVRLDRWAVIAILLCGLLVVAEVSTYAPGIHEFSADAEWGEGTVRYTVSSSGSDTYDAVLLDNGVTPSATKVYFYVDENYDRFFEQAREVTGLHYQNPDYMAVQVTEALKIRGFTEVIRCDSAGLTEMINGTKGSPQGIGLIVMSYALPTSVYTGSPDDPFMEWLNAGGIMYSQGVDPCRFHSDSSGLYAVDGNQELVFGKKCINTDGPKIGLEASGSDFDEALTLKNSSLQFAMDPEGLENGERMGFVSGGYASTSMASIGKGAVFVFGGFFDVKEIDDMAQVISAGLVPTTEVLGHHSGKVTRGSDSDSFSFAEGSPSLYVYIGGTYTKYGGSFHV